MARPFSGLRVLDVGRYIAAPYCAALLGDFGADVVKVEPPGGEFVRRQPPAVEGDSTYVLVHNRSKRGITLNLKDERGRALLRDLATRADVLIENFRPGVMAALGCDYETLRARNPRLIMASISGFGQDGPYATRPAFDSIAQAMSGLMSLTGEPNGPPLLNGTFVADYASALYAMVGILVALRSREQTGEGQLVDVALLDSAVSLLTTAIPDFVLAGQTLARAGARDRYRCPVNAYPTRDGHVYIAAVTQEQFAGLLSAMGRQDLATDPRFATADDRLGHVAALDAIVAAWTEAQTTAGALDQLRRAGVPSSRVSTVADVVDDPQLRARGMIVEVEHPGGTRVPLPGLPIHLSRTPGQVAGSAPRAGQHNRDVLRDWLDLDEARVAALAREGIL